MFSAGFISFIVLIYRTLCSFLCATFYAISLNTDEFLSISIPTSKLIFGDFNLHHKELLSYLVKMKGLKNSAIILLSQLPYLNG